MHMRNDGIRAIRQFPPAAMALWPNRGPQPCQLLVIRVPLPPTTPDGTIRVVAKRMLQSTDRSGNHCLIN